MSHTYNDGYNIYKGGNAEKFNKSYHSKDLRKKNNAYKKRHGDPEKDVETSYKYTDRMPSNYDERNDNIYFYPNMCGCCWKNGTKWYTRHHNDIMRKGKNKDKLQRKYKPSYLSTFCKRQMIKEGLNMV